MKDAIVRPSVFSTAHGEPTDTQLLTEVREGFNTVWHASCTCKISAAKDKMAVVDGRAKVYNVQWLKVVDASSFALLPPGHSVSAIYALTERIADDIEKIPVVV